jgi:predicted anti-sigma-YlaC factor YlaD
MNDHFDRLTLERFSVADVTPALRDAVAGHLSSCASCRGYLTELEQAHADRMSAVPPARFVAVLAARREGDSRRDKWALWAVSAVGVTAAAIAMVVFVGIRDDSATRFKGSTGVVVHRRRGSEVRTVAEGERIRPGDALRVELALPRREKVSAWVEEGSRRTPLTGAAGELTLAAGTQVLPGSLVIEAPCADLVLVVNIGASTTRRGFACE